MNGEIILAVLRRLLWTIGIVGFVGIGDVRVVRSLERPWFVRSFCIFFILESWLAFFPLLEIFVTILPFAAVFVSLLTNGLFYVFW